jgi:hypothetical protein
VGEEGQPAQHDPGPEQAGRDGEQQDLDQAALDERELEGLEDARQLNENESSLLLARFQIRMLKIPPPMR